uniref:NADH-ubiquinone oxidoreductase chain 6 n=1 Tax=Ectopleura larynx TaxID=264052 RepID=G9ISH9_9CNID|nr:NADH dehydrogenase subunit 6 [Ectopleura larynx]
MNIVILFFFILLLSSCLLVINSINPIHSIFWLVLTFILSAIILIILDFKFIPIILVIIYVGAIAILFIFVIMMLDVVQISLIININNSIPIILIILSLSSFFFSKLDLLSFLSSKTHNYEIINSNDIIIISNILYSNYWESFIYISVLLLIAMIGTIILTLENKKTTKLQNLNFQHHRNNSWTQN